MRRGVNKKGFFIIRPLSLAGRIIFFLDIFLALMIITSSTFLIKTSFGRVSLAFGFIMLAFTVLLRIARKW